MQGDRLESLLNKITAVAILSAASYLAINYLGTTYFKKKDFLKKMEGHPDIQKISRMDFNSYELSILDSLVLPQANSITFDDIGGLQDIINDLKDSIFFPLEAAKLYKLNSSSKSNNEDLFNVPKGILFYGPPGTGKTMMAKAIANYAGYNFLSIDHSMLDHKYYGETEKSVAAIFSVAKKIQPTIIFIDEVDSMTGNRTMEHETTLSKKSLLLSLWDGFHSGSNDKIIIIGATNRIDVIDKAFLRRFEKRFLIKLPDEKQRNQILRIILKEYTDSTFDFDSLSRITNGYSGSELKTLCKAAFNDVLKTKVTTQNTSPIKLRLDDFKKPLVTKMQQNTNSLKLD